MTIDIQRHQDRIMVITIDRPEALNALDVPSMKAFRDALQTFRDDDTLRVAVLTGQGDRSFCVGADLKNTRPPDSSFAESYFKSVDDSIDAGLYVRAIAIGELGIEKPIIAAVNGFAIGGGLEIALACDIRIASENASFSLAEPRWATVPAIGGVSRLLRAVPEAVAMKMLLTGDRIDAEEAYRVGLVSDLVPAGEALTSALRAAERIAANGPLAVRAIKQVTTRSRNLPLSESVAFEQVMWGVLRDTEDRIEGREAFSQKRTPQYRGR